MIRIGPFCEGFNYGLIKDRAEYAKHRMSPKTEVGGPTQSSCRFVHVFYLRNEKMDQFCLCLIEPGG
jgi:hypothetical protein